MREHLRAIWRSANLETGRTRWYAINPQEGGPSQVMIYDEIGFWGITAQDFVSDLQATSGDLELHINSPGGNIFDGLAIYNALKQRPGKVGVVVDGLAASAASFIAQAASPGELAMARTATMMIHDGWGGTEGTGADLRKFGEVLEQQSDIIASIYAERSGAPAATWREAMRAESWYSALEAVEARLADKVLTAGPQNSLRNAWDGPAAMAKCHSAADFRSICAGEKTVGDPDTQAHWALPHHNSPGAAANPDGVSAALGRLNQTHDLKSPEAARRHLEAHQSAEGGGDSSNQADDPFSGWDPQWFKEALRGALQ